MAGEGTLFAKMREFKNGNEVVAVVSTPPVASASKNGGGDSGFSFLSQKLGTRVDVIAEFGQSHEDAITEELADHNSDRNDEIDRSTGELKV